MAAAAAAVCAPLVCAARCDDGVWRACVGVCDWTPAKRKRKTRAGRPSAFLLLCVCCSAQPAPKTKKKSHARFASHSADHAELPSRLCAARPTRSENKKKITHPLPSVHLRHYHHHPPPPPPHCRHLQHSPPASTAAAAPGTPPRKWRRGRAGRRTSPPARPGGP